MKKKSIIGLVGAVVMLAAVVGASAEVSAIDKCVCPSGANKGQTVKAPAKGCGELSSKECGAGFDKTQNQQLMPTVTGIIDVISRIVGFLSVLMIIIGGITYTTSAGDPGKVKKAKDTIMYGIIGLVVALLAFAIVNFVLINVGK